MRVTLLSFTPEPEKLVATAANLCYSNKPSIRIVADNLSDETIKRLIKKIISSKHESVLEHTSFSFGIEGVSRALLAQLSRHRICSLSVRSQRYCSEDNFDYVVPKTIDEGGYVVSQTFHTLVQEINATYNAFVSKNVPKEDARAILPNAACTRLILSMNARELRHFFNLRCCQHAQEEIRRLAYEMLRQVKEVAPLLFDDAGPACTSLGYCPEIVNPCGKKPTLKEIMNIYQSVKSKQSDSV